MLTGDENDNDIYGGAGNDVLTGSSGHNRMFGGDGDDTSSTPRIVQGVDAGTANKIADAVLQFIVSPPFDDSCRNYSCGAYSRRNLESFAADIR